MPKQTFFNLSEEKKQTLIQAGKNEFSRVSLAEASIANIVKEAKIPRGSFYQYFYDKEDLYFYLLTEMAKERRAEFILSLKKHNGDIFNSLTELFHLMIVEMENDSLRKFYRNVFLNMNYKTEKAFLDNMNLNSFNKQYVEIKYLLNTEHLNVSNEEELFQLVQIVLMTMMQNLVQKFANDMSNESVIQNYSVQMCLLKRGLLKVND
ncbi:TetR/AcrR family transcriptional regulator [Pseudogracilibacillus auburnensis]|uniref:TetR/AcrR family transcriptional regulator n=1 Tax=Pseudogracilibacillus auburnensis TaxID=1494959 RepID=UPI001A96FF1F|nr:TetR/AcrR family transcriptional regulator [Pseudogracilibacillus auburnensis]MBO1004194.1 TetR family transcriptional regulator [Pseudogracilibacillus auburnensis]